jgi:UDP-N-acetylmuramyl pentapeptide phosphotransferase/UDP-N-acetylglucosamine-1-phosphate transferase
LFGLWVIEWIDPVVLGASFENLFVAGLIPFLFGFAEDLTKRVSVRARLLASASGAAVFIVLTGVYLNRLDIPGVDGLISWTAVAVAVTVFAVSGVTNAINIIDGFHGLAAGTVILILLAFGVVAHGMQDTELLNLCLLLACVMAGFLVINYPLGKIFLGDGGAYFVGFLVAEIAIMLPMRHPQLSPWVSLMICAYPVVEVLYSMFRRARDKRSSGAPDNQHLHTLIKTQWIRPRFPKLSANSRNALVSPYMWSLGLLPLLWAIVWVSSWGMLVLGFVGFVVLYHGIYNHLKQLQSKAKRT